jgi:flavin reductase (DIM6/NTAB) family NADH-FMN oxidoreductase RutF
MAATAELSSSSQQQQQQELPTFLHLTDKKTQLSRLLYANPVCFLCTTSSATAAAIRTSEDVDGISHRALLQPPRKNDGPNKEDRQCKEEEEEEERPSDNHNHHSSTHSRYKKRKNAMVLSWITPTSNAATFCFSIHKRRGTARNLLQQQQSPSARCFFFTLCVPVAGMEDLVLAVGSVSSRRRGSGSGSSWWTRSKFENNDEDDSNDDGNGREDEEVDATTATPTARNDSRGPEKNMQERAGAAGTGEQQPTRTSIRTSGSSNGSKRQKKKRLQATGIVPGLRCVPVGGGGGQQRQQQQTPRIRSPTREGSDEDNAAMTTTTMTMIAPAVPAAARGDAGGKEEHHCGASTSGSTEEGGLFAVAGTVCHMVCRVQQILDGVVHDNDSSDSDHLLVLAVIEHAYVDVNYWDTNKNLFRPMECNGTFPPPYLSFFGSQTFGYTTNTPCTAPKRRNNKQEDQQQAHS